MLAVRRDGRKKGITENEYRLIALDMDGTLLNSRHEITPRAKRAIERYLARGKQVVFLPEDVLVRWKPI